MQAGSCISTHHFTKLVGQLLHHQAESLELSEHAVQVLTSEATNTLYFYRERDTQRDLDYIYKTSYRPS